MAETFIVDTKIAGVSFDNPDGSSRQKYLTQLNGKSDLKLVREPKNKFDENAVKVMFGRKQLGYLPRNVAVVIAALMDRKMKVIVDHWSVGGNNLLGCKLRLMWRD